MRMIIYGAGGIGGVVGGHLARVGHQVVLIGRPGHMNAIREHGLRLITPVGTHTLRLPAFTSPDQISFQPDDVVLLCMKSQNTDEALSNLCSVTEDIPIFCLQNGVRNEEIAAKYFPRVYGVMVRVGAVYLTDGEVIARRDPPGWLIIGRYPSGTEDLVEVVAANLRTAGFVVMTTSDIMPYKWGKLMGNLANAIGAITNARGEDNNQIARAARDEAIRILAQANIRWVSDGQLATEWPDFNVPPRSILSTEAQSSTWQSLARGRDTVETDFLNGEIVRLAERLSIRAPVNEALLHISQEMAAKGERPGKYTPTELGRLIRLE
ncbi:MAG: hypothetical protein A2Y60_05715 [Chloroflexi bacterium RBG_13_54_9]|nr:MAG: hypothetical protein A2Y60_05715 [Chloroflexi bacterium RBG_13_54_9]